MTYVKIFLLTLIGLFNQQANAQLTNSILGRWKVTNIQLSSDEFPEGEKLEYFKNLLLKSSFEFKSDQNFSYEIDDKDMRVDNGHWKYVDKTRSYVIQEWSDKEKERSILMEIIVRQKDNKTFFLLVESPFILEVELER